MVLSHFGSNPRKLTSDQLSYNLSRSYSTSLFLLALLELWADVGLCHAVLNTRYPRSTNRDDQSVTIGELRRFLILSFIKSGSCRAELVHTNSNTFANQHLPHCIVLLLSEASYRLVRTLRAIATSTWLSGHTSLARSSTVSMTPWIFWRESLWL